MRAGEEELQRRAATGGGGRPVRSEDGWRSGWFLARFRRWRAPDEAACKRVRAAVAKGPPRAALFGVCSLLLAPSSACGSSACALVG